jgi:hypothetical protein
LYYVLKLADFSFELELDTSSNVDEIDAKATLSGILNKLKMEAEVSGTGKLTDKVRLA